MRLDHVGLVAFDVADLDGTFERVVRMAFVADPEGNLVELLSRGGLS